MHRREVNFQRTLVTKSLEADIALHPLLPRGWVDELDAEAEWPGRRRRLAALRVVLRRALLAAPVVVAAAEAGAELAKVKLRCRRCGARHHEVVQAGHNTELFAFHSSRHSTKHVRSGRRGTRSVCD